MQADVAHLGSAYRALHPGLLRYQSQAEFDGRLNALTVACARPQSLSAFYAMLSRFLSTVRCGHSYANFYNQTDAVQAALFSGKDRLPFPFRWIGTDMVITADPSGTGLSPGSIVETIEGRPVSAVLAALLPLVRADGHNDAKRKALLSVQLDDDFETFDIFYPLIFGGRERHTLRVREPRGARRTISLAAIDLDQRRAQRPPHGNAKGDDALWTMTRVGKVAVLTMPGWDVYDSKWDWRAWLNARLDEIATDGTAGLVIDLRANEGGLDCGDPIISRLADRPVQTLAARRLVRYRRVPDELRPILRTWDKSFFDWGDRAVRRDERFYDLLPEQAEAPALAPTGKRFRGRVAVLVGPQNSSATFNFAQRMQRERLGLLVGEPTGGNRRGINGGCFFFARLPASGLEFDLPLIGVFPVVPQPDAGLLPDVAVAPTVADIAAGRDPALAAARAWARRA